ncbi:MAG: phosphopantetheine-binding protein [Conexibacter sp.]
MSAMHDLNYETVVRSVLGEIFDTEVLPDDDFFTLGGDSLRALHVLDRLSQLLSIPEELTLVVLAGLLDTCNVRDFAALLGSLSLDAGVPHARR